MAWIYRTGSKSAQIVVQLSEVKESVSGQSKMANHAKNVLVLMMMFS